MLLLLVLCSAYAEANSEGQSMIRVSDFYDTGVTCGAGSWWGRGGHYYLRPPCVFVFISISVSLCLSLCQSANFDHDWNSGSIQVTVNILYIIDIVYDTHTDTHIPTDTHKNPHKHYIVIIINFIFMPPD